MREYFSIITTDKIIFYGVTMTLLLLTMSVSTILVFYQSLPPIIPLYNQLPWGTVRLAAKHNIFIPVGVAGIIFLGNFLASWYLYKHLPLLARIFCTTALLTSFFSLLLIVRVIQLIV